MNSKNLDELAVEFADFFEGLYGYKGEVPKRCMIEGFKNGWIACEKEIDIVTDKLSETMDQNSKIYNQLTTTQGELKVQEGIFLMFQKGMVKDTERLHKLQSDYDKLETTLKRLQDECRQACHYDLLEMIDEALRKDG